MNKKILIALLVLSLVLTGCAKAATEVVSVEESKYMEQPSMAPQAMDTAGRNSAGYGLAASPPAEKQMIIMNADLSIAVDDPIASMKEIGEIAERMGGFVVSSSRYQGRTADGKQVPEGSIAIRIPAEKLTEIMDEIKAMTGDAATYVLSENVNGTDVTKDYTDLASRLRNLEKASEELDRFYETATKTEDVLAIYNQKTSVNEQIEIIKGQMQYYEQASALSLLNVHLQAKAVLAPITIAGWKPAGIARDAIQALVNGLKILANVLIWTILFVLPFLLIIGLPIFFIVRAARRGKNKTKTDQKTE